MAEGIGLVEVPSEERVRTTKEIGVTLSEPTGLEVRRLRPAEAGAVLTVYRQCEDFLALGPEPRASMGMVVADMETSSRDRGVFCGIYKRDGEVIGVVDYVPDGVEGQRDVTFVSLLMIAKPFRGLGYGSAIVKLLERQSNDRRASSIRTSVQVNNPEAMAFWQHRGYGIIGVPERRPDRTTVFRLEKTLVGQRSGR